MSKPENQARTPEHSLESVQRKVEQVPPHDAAAEIAAIGAALIDSMACRTVCDTLTEIDFYVPKNRAAFIEILKLRVKGKKHNEVTLSNVLSKNGWSLDDARNYCGRLIMQCPSAGGIDDFCEILKEKSNERLRIEAAGKLAAGASSEEIRKILDKTNNNAAATCGAAEVLKEIQDEIDGKRAAVQFPHWPVFSSTQALMPSTVTLICGSPGTSKSFFALEPVWRLVLEKSVRAAVLELEKGARFHMRRALVQMCGQAALTNSQWVTENPDEARQYAEQYRSHMEQLKNVIYSPQGPATCDYMLDWMRARSDEGCRVLCIDPVSIMQGQEKRFLDHEHFVEGAMKIIERYQNSLICITHPRDTPGGPAMPCLSNIPGSRMWERCCDTIMWLEWHTEAYGTFKSIEPATELYPSGTRELSYNRTLHDLKVRNAAKPGKIAYVFETKSLTHREIGALED